MTIVDLSTQVSVESGARFTLLQTVHFVAKVLHSLHIVPHGLQVAGDPLENEPGGIAKELINVHLSGIAGEDAGRYKLKRVAS